MEKPLYYTISLDTAINLPLSSFSLSLVTWQPGVIRCKDFSLSRQTQEAFTNHCSFSISCSSCTVLCKTHYGSKSALKSDHPRMLYRFSQTLYTWQKFVIIDTCHEPIFVVLKINSHIRNLEILIVNTKIKVQLSYTNRIPLKWEKKPLARVAMINKTECQNFHYPLKQH